MTGKIQAMTIILMTTILLSGGIVPYSFANDDDDEYDDEDVCQVPKKFAVKYDGPPNAEVEIYKKSKQAKQGERVIKDFPGQTFSSGDLIILDAVDDLEQDKINPRTVYKIMHGSDWEIIPFNTSCKKPIEKHDYKTKGGITLTIEYGKDKDGDDVIYEKYRKEEANTIQECSGENVVLLDFESDDLQHGSQQAAIQSYLSGIGPDNFEIVYDAQTNGPVNDPGAIYDSRNNGGADEDLEDPEPNPPIVGNMLIIQENNQQTNDDPPLWSNPDDESSGGKQILSFEDGQGNPVGVDVLSWRNIDLEGYDETNVVTVEFLDSIPDLTKSLKKTGNDKHEIQEEGDFVDVKKITYDLEHSGGITDICIRLPDPPTKGSITVTKVVEEQTPGSTFAFDLNGEFTPQPLGNGDSHTFAELDPDVEYVLTEVYDPEDYTLVINCNEDGANVVIDNAAGTATITLISSENPSCTYTNTEIVPAMITLKKVITQDNTDEAAELADTSDFAMFITDVGLDGMPGTEDDGTPIPIVEEDQEVPAGTYTLSETGPDNFEFVLITGDTGCPTMVEDMETFTLESGDDLTCVIYNDDDADAPQGGGDGFFFARSSVEIAVNEFSQFDEDDSPNSCNLVPNGFPTPCVKEGDESSEILLVDEAFEEEGADLAAVLITLQPIGNIKGECTGVVGIGEHTYKKLDGTPADAPTKGVLINCPSLQDMGIFKMNYAIMKTVWAAFPGDLVDNDNDGLVDEDPLDGIDTNGNGIIDQDERIDTDGDGLIDEDP